MRKGRKRVVLVAVALLAVLTGPVRGEDDLPCADYVSSGRGDAPLFGFLLGTSTVTYEIRIEPGGVGTTIKETFEVGHYQMSDGSTMRIDCRTYTQYK